MLPVPLVQIKNTTLRARLGGVGRRIDRYTLWAFNPPAQSRSRDLTS